MNNNDELWLIETNYKSGWNTRFKNGTYRGMQYGIVLRDYPKKVEPSIEVLSVSRNVRDFFPRTQGHRRVGATTSILQRKTGAPTYLLLCVRVGAKSYFARISSRQRARFVGPVEQGVTHHDWTQRQVQKHARIPGKTVHIRKGYLAPITELTLILSLQGSTFNAMKLRRRARRPCT